LQLLSGDNVSKYAYFNPADNNKVMQWIDTAAMSYDLPDSSLLHECTETEWLQRNSGEKMVKAGAVVNYVEPAKTQEEINAEAWHEFQARAKNALEKTSITVERVAEAVSLGLTTWVALDVVAFMQYRRDLRAILNQAQPDVIPESLPTSPAYPTGT
jgi:hypothetical protein